jgi:7-dehydrocholesterol reductase
MQVESRNIAELTGNPTRDAAAERARPGSTSTILAGLLIVVAPVFVLLFGYALLRGGGSIADTFAPGWLARIVAWAAPTWTSAGIVIGFAAFEAFLLVAIPARRVLGPVTPAGRQPDYKDNGFAAWAITHLAFFAAAYPLGWFSASAIVDHFGAIVSTASLLALVGCALLYVKGRAAPPSADAGTSGNPVFDFFWGVELHPRIGHFDLKQFANCRLGMMSWSLILWSCAAKQAELQGHVSNAMWVVAILEGVYVAKFFLLERAYFSTMDVMHDRFGYYICWGILGWLPVVYPSAALYLVSADIAVPGWLAVALVAFGLAAMWVSHDADQQRQRVRKTAAQTTVWGKPPAVIHATYRASDGRVRENLLLTSGWWGVARHFHYATEIALAVAWTLPCGFRNVLPWFYPAYLAVLLVHRAFRDDRKCKAKYGAYWDRYCSAVPYRILPGLL